MSPNKVRESRVEWGQSRFVLGCLQSSKGGFLREWSRLQGHLCYLLFPLSVGVSYFLTGFGHVEAASPYDDSLYPVSCRGSIAIPLSEASSCLITMKRRTI